MNSRIVAELLESFPKLLLPGLKVTLPLTALSFTIGIAIALATALVQIAHIPVLRRLARVYIWIIRCTPMIVQLFVVYVNGQNGWQSGILRDEVGKGGILAKSGDCG